MVKNCYGTLLLKLSKITQSESLLIKRQRQHRLFDGELSTDEATSAFPSKCTANYLTLFIRSFVRSLARSLARARTIICDNFKTVQDRMLVVLITKVAYGLLIGTEIGDLK